ncbi:MAG: hypothetical protein ACYDCQ_12470 [Dehalococcoidia bacterium]
MTTLRPEALTGWNRALIVDNADEPYRSLIAGTNRQVYAIYSAYRSSADSWELLRELFEYLSEDQLRAAMGYAFELLPGIESYWQGQDERTAAALLELWLKSPTNRPPHLRDATPAELARASRPPKW